MGMVRYQAHDAVPSDSKSASSSARAQAASATGDGTGDDAGVVPSPNDELGVFAAFDIDAYLGFTDAGRRLHGHAPNDRQAVRDTAKDAARVVALRLRPGDFHAVRVVVLRSQHARGAEPRPELDALDGGNPERDAGDAVLDAVEHGVAQPGGNPVGDAFDHSTDAVEVVFRSEDRRAHPRRRRRAHAGQRVGEDGRQLDLVGLHGIERGVIDRVRSELGYVRRDADAASLEGLQGDAPGYAQRGREPTGEMAPSGDVLVPAVLDLRRPVRMAGTGLAAQLVVILAAGVAVAYDRRDGRAVGAAVRDAGDELGRVRLSPRGGGLVSSGRPAGQEGTELVEVDGNSRGDAVERAADCGGVRLPEDGEVQHVAVYGSHDRPYSS